MWICRWVQVLFTIIPQNRMSTRWCTKILLFYRHLFVRRMWKWVMNSYWIMGQHIGRPHGVACQRVTPTLQDRMLLRKKGQSWRTCVLLTVGEHMNFMMFCDNLAVWNGGKFEIWQLQPHCPPPPCSQLVLRCSQDQSRQSFLVCKTLFCCLRAWLEQPHRPMKYQCSIHTSRTCVAQTQTLK